MKEDKPSRREEDSIPPADDDSTSISSGMNEALDSESIVFNRMPLLNYFRIGGSSVPGVDPGATINDTGNQEDQICMCSAMAQVMVETSGLAPSSSEGKRSASSNLGTGDNDHRHLLNSDLWKHPYHVIAFGLKDGSIEFRSAYSGALLINEERFTIPGVQSDVPPPVVDISFDSTGTAMVAIDLDGNVAMWEIKYSVSFQHRGTRDSHLLRSSEAPPVSHVNRKEAQKESESCLFSLPTLTVDSVSVSRSRYPNSWAKPTCITIDPANRRSREKSFITGFQDGRLVLTRRGGLFQRRNDTVVYHGTPDASESFIKYRGIECIAWRGSFVAWADANGIKLLDVQSLTRIAHIDRPSGARPSLYPSISSLQPSLVFERSHSLLISWGDCLMVIEIEDSKEPGSANKKRSVECSMAWELDCVACGVAPLDTDHVLVLGLVPVEDDAESVTVAARANDIDVQILSRADGAVVYCDSLPVLQRSNISSAVGGDVSKSGTSLKLLSSFALSKMEDSIEVEEQKRFISNAMGELDTSVLFAPDFGEAGNHVFHDAHLQWNLISAYEEEANVTYFDGETDSVDSDDYGFILRPEADLLGSKRENETPTGAPPVMVIVTPSAMIRSQTSTVDDAIAHALSRNMSALALKHGLLHKQEIRRYQTVDLVDNFLQSLLRLNKKYRGEMDAPVPTSSRPLSLRRMQIALRSMPNLLGDRVARWEKWIKKLDAIPGVIFLLRENLPVRDPVLPPLVYERVLIKMFREVEDLIHDDTESRKGLFLREEAVDHFLNSLLSWGPSSALQEYIGLYSPRNRKSRECQTLEIALRRRHFQSSKGFLSFPATTLETESDTATSEPPERSTEGAKESLYSIVNVMKIIAIHAPMLTKRGEFENGVQESEDSDRRMNSLLSFEAMGRFRVMQQSYHDALRCYLMIGFCHGDRSINEIERSAISAAKEPRSINSPREKRFFAKYEFVLDLIEYHHLHRYLLDEKFFSDESPPLFALIQLVGLDRGSRFLMEHCVAPELPSLEVEFEVSSMSGTKDMVQKETLPLDLVARQLARSPPFLYWYLNMIFTEKPELYVRFPNNYIPPKTVTELHRKHLDLHVKFADGNKFSDQALLGVEKYEVNTFSTPLLSFLKAALPVGGLSALEVRRLLESHRSKEAAGSDKSLSAQKSSCFALELAFVIEHSGDQSATEAKGILDLYLDGANSLNLAVSYAQRQKDYSNLLWDELIGYCLDNVSQRREGEGLLFGALLEASAVYGADLSRLVSRIPAGMVVEGLRPRLVSAVADYRLKLDVHEAALTVSEEEKSSMQRQVAHRSKRGVRYSPIWNAKGTNGGNSDSVADPSKEDHSKAIAITKPKLRRDRYRLSYSSPMR